MTAIELLEKLEAIKNNTKVWNYEVFIQQKKIKTALFGEVSDEHGDEFHITFVAEDGSYI
jgi:hypothetical protein